MIKKLNFLFSNNILINKYGFFEKTNKIYLYTRTQLYVLKFIQKHLLVPVSSNLGVQRTYLKNYHSKNKNHCISNFLLVNSTKNFFNQIVLSKFQKQIFITLLGKKISIEVVGYFRRLWYAEKKKLIIFRLGFSFLKRFVLAKQIFLKIKKKRIMRFFSFHLDLLKKTIVQILSIQPSELYKYTGFLYYKKRFKLKKSKKQRYGSSY